MGPWQAGWNGLAGQSPRSLSSRLRSRRWEMLFHTFPDLAEMAVLDLGGTAQNWSLAPVQPRHVTLVNPLAPEGPLPDWVEHVVADACELPNELSIRSWDLVYSNSVIEHVGGHYRCKQFASAVRSLAPLYWVQTPNRYFPVEPHFMFPGIQFMPVRVRRTLARRWPLHEGTREESSVLLEEVMDIHLLGRTELAAYFPDATILKERVVGLPKSLVAIRA